MIRAPCLLYTLIVDNYVVLSATVYARIAINLDYCSYLCAALAKGRHRYNRNVPKGCYRIGGTKKSISYSLPSDMRKASCLRSKTLNQPFAETRHTSSGRRSATPASPPVLAGSRQWLGYNFSLVVFLSFLLSIRTTSPVSTGKKRLWRTYRARRKQSWYLSVQPAIVTVDTLERGSWKETLYQAGENAIPLGVGTLIMTLGPQRTFVDRFSGVYAR